MIAAIRRWFANAKFPPMSHEPVDPFAERERTTAQRIAEAEAIDWGVGEPHPLTGYPPPLAPAPATKGESA